MLFIGGGQDREQAPQLKTTWTKGYPGSRAAIEDDYACIGRY